MQARLIHQDASLSTCQGSVSVRVESQHSLCTIHNLTGGTIKQVSLVVRLFENEDKEAQTKIKLTRRMHVPIPYSMLTMADKFLADTISQNMHSNVLQHKLRL